MEIIYPVSSLRGAFYEVKILYGMGWQLILETYSFCKILDGTGRPTSGIGLSSLVL